MKIDFVIRTLNEGKTLQKVLDNIYIQETNIRIGVIIVDSGSVDETLDIAIKNKCIVTKITKEEWSWGRALNIGIQKSDADYIAIISGHCYLNGVNFVNDAVEILNSGISAVYGRQQPLKGYDVFEEIELCKWYPDRDEINIDLNNLTGVSNACCVMKKNAWDILKFDETAESMEDGIWAVNALRKNMKLLYSPKISLYHSHPYDEKYIYRKWYSRTLQGLKFSDEMFRGERKYEVKYLLKRMVYFPYFFCCGIYEFIEFLLLYYIDKETSVSRACRFYNTKFNAILNAHHDFFRNEGKGYWQIL